MSSPRTSPCRVRAWTHRLPLHRHRGRVQGDAVLIGPPLNVTYDELDALVARLSEAIGSIAAEAAPAVRLGGRAAWGGKEATG